MRSVTGNYFESKVRLEKVTEDGTQAKFNELFTVNAMSFSECEEKVMKYVPQYASGEFEVLTEKRAKYNEIFYSDKPDESLWYGVTLEFITINEKTMKEKRSKTAYLVQGSSVESARKNVEEVMKDTAIDYRILGLNETVVQDIID